MAIALAFIIFIGTYVTQERSYDTFVGEDIYVGSDAEFFPQDHGLPPVGNLHPYARQLPVRLADCRSHCHTCDLHLYRTLAADLLLPHRQPLVDVPAGPAHRGSGRNPLHLIQGRAADEHQSGAGFKKRLAQRNWGEMHIFVILNLGENRYFASKDFGEMKNLSIFAWTNICNDGI